MSVHNLRQPTQTRLWLCVAAAAILAAWPAERASATKLVMKDGRLVEGSIAKLASMAEKAGKPPAESAARPILVCDDGLRRTYVSQRGQVQEVSEAAAIEVPEKFFVYQRVPRFGGRVAMVGPLSRVDPFDEFGRRVVEMSTNQGQVAIVQGITEVTPLWAKVEAIDVDGKNYLWETRLATSSIPRETLGKVLEKQIDRTMLDHRLKVVRLYLQSNRYRDAELELTDIVRDFPESKNQYDSTLIKLRQAYARRYFEEVEVRRKGAQHHLVLSMLKAFPTENVAGETLQLVRELSTEYDSLRTRGAKTLENIDAQIAALPTDLREELRPLRDEIFAEINVNTLERMDTFNQFVDVKDMTAEEKVALAASGWLVGANNTTRNLPVAISLWRVRNKVRDYVATSAKLDRLAILDALRSEEGATPETVAQLLSNMNPPMELPPAVQGVVGLYQGAAPMLERQAPMPYFVQLPPEYDPHRAYPAILTLHGTNSTPIQQIEWWAGSVQPDGTRLGQASRYGYIVIAPAWGREHQLGYEYSLYEHLAVLNTLRDACRRFSIDTDRVFLTGHSMGGDAAWDLGISHPDLWAGVIPIAATAAKFVSLYWENAEYVPFYFVCGELDGDKMVRNSMDYDRYLRYHYNATIVEYRGRGHEHFSDEILRLFDWMERYKRDFFPREFTARSMRAWDNYFWWVEVDGLPAKTVVDPSAWPPPRTTQPMLTRASINATNGLNVRTGAEEITVWVSPQMIDFSQPTSVTINGGRVRTSGPYLEPDVAVMLEDVRTRGDRQHPFWAKVEMPGARINVAER